MGENITILWLLSLCTVEEPWVPTLETEVDHTVEDRHPDYNPGLSVHVYTARWLDLMETTPYLPQNSALPSTPHHPDWGEETLTLQPPHTHPPFPPGSNSTLVTAFPLQLIWQDARSYKKLLKFDLSHVLKAWICIWLEARVECCCRTCASQRDGPSGCVPLCLRFSSILASTGKMAVVRGPQTEQRMLCWQVKQNIYRPIYTQACIN